MYGAGGQFVNVNSGMCLAVGGASRDNGAAVIQFPCNGRNEQKWTGISHDHGLFHYINVNSGKCLSVGSASEEPGAGIIQWQCNDRVRSEQLWLSI